MAILTTKIAFLLYNPNVYDSVYGEYRKDMVDRRDISSKS